MRRAALFGPLALALACRHLPGLAPGLPDCPGELLATEEMEGRFLRREAVRIRGAEVEVALELAVQRRGGELVLVGFSPLGARLFAVTQRGVATSVEAGLGRALPIPPLNLLRDLHRVRFLAAGEPAPGEETSLRLVGGSAIREEWREGRLLTRRIEGPGGRAAAELRFEPPGAGGGPPRVLLRNEACGYEATWTLLSEELLP